MRRLVRASLGNLLHEPDAVTGFARISLGRCQF
jgi:hypothetical protein